MPFFWAESVAITPMYAGSGPVGGGALLPGSVFHVTPQVGEVEVVSDSELLVKQMNGEYRVKNEALRQLSLEASRHARRVGKVRYTAVRREQNELADRLVNEALDAAGA